MAEKSITVIMEHWTGNQLKRIPIIDLRVFIFLMILWALLQVTGLIRYLRCGVPWF